MKAVLEGDNTKLKKTMNDSAKEMKSFAKEMNKEIRGMEKTFATLGKQGAGGILGFLVGGAVGAVIGKLVEDLGEAAGIQIDPFKNLQETIKILSGSGQKEQQEAYANATAETVKAIEDEQAALFAKRLEMEKGTEAAKVFLAARAIEQQQNPDKQQARADRERVEALVRQTEEMRRQTDEMEKQRKKQEEITKTLDQLRTNAQKAGLDPIDAKMIDLEKQGFNKEQLAEARKLLELEQQRKEEAAARKKINDDAAQAEKDAADDLERQNQAIQQEMEKDANKIKADLRNPQQVFQDEIANLQDLKAAGLLTQEQFEAAARQAGGRLGSSDGARFATGATRGSVEAFEGQARHRAGKSQNPADILLKQLKLDEKIAQILEAIKEQGENEAEADL